MERENTLSYMFSTRSYRPRSPGGVQHARGATRRGSALLERPLKLTTVRLSCPLAVRSLRRFRYSAVVYSISPSPQSLCHRRSCPFPLPSPSNSSMAPFISKRADAPPTNGSQAVLPSSLDPSIYTRLVDLLISIGPKSWDVPPSSSAATQVPTPSRMGSIA